MVRNPMKVFTGKYNALVWRSESGDEFSVKPGDIMSVSYENRSELDIRRGVVVNVFDDSIIVEDVKNVKHIVRYADAMDMTFERIYEIEKTPVNHISAVTRGGISVLKPSGALGKVLQYAERVNDGFGKESLHESPDM